MLPNEALNTYSSPLSILCDCSPSGNFAQLHDSPLNVILCLPRISPQRYMMTAIFYCDYLKIIARHSSLSHVSMVDDEQLILVPKFQAMSDF